MSICFVFRASDFEFASLLHPGRQLDLAHGDALGVDHHALAGLPLQDAAHGALLGIGGGDDLVAPGIEPQPAVDAHEVGFFEFDDHLVGGQALSALDGILEHVDGHVAAGGAQPLGLDLPALGVGVEELHRPVSGVGGRVAGVDHVAEREFTLAVRGLPETGLLRGGQGGAERQGGHLHVVPLLKQDRAFRHVHPDVDDLGLGILGFEQP